MRCKAGKEYADSGEVLLGDVRSRLEAKAILRRPGVALRPRVDLRRMGEADERRCLPNADRLMLHSLLRQMQLLEEEIQACEVAIAQRIQVEPLVKLLLTVPGVGIVTVVAIWAFLRDPRRFRKAKQAPATQSWTPRSVRPASATPWGGSGKTAARSYEAFW